MSLVDTSGAPSTPALARLFDIEIDRGRFLYHYDEPAFVYEDLLAGRYVLTTSLDRRHASTAQVVLAYRSLLDIERRFRILKDFLHLRPVRHWTEPRVRAHVAVCVYATVIEALMAQALRAADVRDPDLDRQPLTPARALRELGRIRSVTPHRRSPHHRRRHPTRATPTPPPRRPRR
ncbi:MAG: hypothetical protein ACRD0U_04300 [Acidimicrobiales bacterium]